MLGIYILNRLGKPIPLPLTIHIVAETEDCNGNVWIRVIDTQASGRQETQGREDDKHPRVELYNFLFSSICYYIYIF